MFVGVAETPCVSRTESCEKCAETSAEPGPFLLPFCVFFDPRQCALRASFYADFESVPPGSGDPGRPD